jgi:hypothetical protein
MKTRTLFVAAVLLAAAFAGKAFSSTVAVGNCTKFLSYPTIQLAVTNAPAGSTIKVCPGTYPEQVTITKNLKVIGNGPTASTVVVPPGGLVTNGVTDIFLFPTAAQIFVKNATVTISNLAVDGANDGMTDCSIDPIGIYFQNASGTITNNAVRNVLLPPGLQGCQDGLAINVESNVGIPQVTISNNSIRNYDKNGITVSGPATGANGPNATISGNTVIGLGATTVTAQNGIQVSYGANAEIKGNFVTDDIYSNPPCGGAMEPPCYGSSGILIYASAGVGVSGNTVGSTQFGIVPASDPTYGDANRTLITGNYVGGTQTYDAIDACSDNNGIQKNVIYGSSQDAIHLDDECTPSTGSNNTVTNNTINEACAGVLQGSLSTGNTIPLSGANKNSFLNVDNTVLLDSDSCTPILGPIANARTKSAAVRHLRPSPFKPNRK